VKGKTKDPVNEKIKAKTEKKKKKIESGTCGCLSLLSFSSSLVALFCIMLMSIFVYFVAPSPMFWEGVYVCWFLKLCQFVKPLRTCQNTINRSRLYAAIALPSTVFRRVGGKTDKR
jgi:hypothetical protein